ncbi:MAG: integrase arm-type DNA-binding domain-containing protein [Methylotenera sp.]|uniref:tyrosine-type recombinase/integrase n=1 Tax=Methylotenera sp. TaxID=2051956 RepID=UPI0024890466|nr:integrase arm-type DNA-binding domain-containing protein [Methylotenera sp.]MDI1307889.1 integrase arm-type DNA-binding domain-containing protein [Methylotenera sp.]
MALSVTAIKNAKPKDKAFKLYDEAGLFIQVTPSGGKWWRFKYRYLNKEKLLALGTYPDVSLAEARIKRDEARKLLSQTPPVDPSELKKSTKQSIYSNKADSFELIALEWAESFFTNKSKSHKERTVRRLELYIFPWIGSKPISQITAPEVLEVVKRPQVQSKLETAHRALQAVSQVFRYAVQTGKAMRDVTVDLRGALPSASVKHMASFTEPKQVAELLRAIDAFKGTFTVECALRLSPLVFTRPSELRRAKWADINLDAGEWAYLVTKTKTQHIVPLSTQAIKILKELYPVSGYGEYVFQGGRDPKKAMSEAAINAALQRMGYDTQKDITAHGFRAMARTILHERLNIDPAIIELQLAHAVPDALGGAYNRTKFEQRKVMMQQWADYLDELKAGAKVIPFKTA